MCNCGTRLLPCQYRSLLVHSQDRISGTSTNFVLELPESITNIRQVKLAQANIPNTLYNIITGTNDIMRWNHAGAFTYTIPAGAYTISNLLSDIQTGMNAADANNYVLSYSSTTFKVTFTGTAAFSLTFSGATTPYQELGFTAANTSSGTTIISTNAVSLAQPYNLYITIIELSVDVLTTYNNDKPTFVVPVNVNAGEIIQYSDAANFEQILHYSAAPRDIYRLNVRLHKRSNTVDLNGSEWSFMLDFMRDEQCHP